MTEPVERLTGRENPHAEGAGSAEVQSPPSQRPSLTKTPLDFEVGAKASNLTRLAEIGLRVPSWFVMGTGNCREFLTRRSLSREALDAINAGVKKLEHETRLTLGDKRKPLLVSVRSSAAVSMPGIMETILDVGLCDKTVEGMIRMTGNPRFVWDSYRRFVQEYAEAAYHCKDEPFNVSLSEHLASEAVASPRYLDTASLRELVEDYLHVFKTQTGRSFPQDPMEQLVGAVKAVFESWESNKAQEYRAIHDLRGLLGTAAIVQSMVYGNMGATSGSGVAFTRNPATGRNQLYMDFLFNAQGEDLVSGKQSVPASNALRRVLPGVYAELQAIRKRLEVEFKDMQDFEFTVQEGELFILQTRNGKRTPWAAVQIAADLFAEGLIDRATAVGRLRDYDLDKVQRTVLTEAARGKPPLCTGVPTGVGVATGQIVFDSETALKKHPSNESSFILVRDAISTEDISGIAACAGILARTGGKTSHAAVVARQMGKVCVVGCSDLSISPASGTCRLMGKTLHERDYISLDGGTGAVYEGRVEVTVERPPCLAEVKQWQIEEAAKAGRPESLPG